MTIDEAVAALSPADVRWTLSRGHAFDPAGTDSFAALAEDARRLGIWPEDDAWDTLAKANEAEVRAALAAIDSLSEAALEGSARALQGLRERGLELPRDCRYAGAWL